MPKLPWARRAFAAFVPLFLVVPSVTRAVVRNDLTFGDPTAFPGAVAFGNSVNFTGSATVIGGGQYVLTAAHVIPQSDLNGASYRVRTQDGTILNGTGVVAIDPNADLALVQLSSPLTSWYDLYAGTDEVGKTITFTGFGLGSSTVGDGGSNLPAGTARQGFNRISAAVGSNELRFDFDLAGTSNDLNGDGLGPAEATTLSGDSGMGWLAEVGSNYQLLGVHSGVFNPPGANRDQSISFGTRVSAEMNWILSNIPEPACAVVVVLVGVLPRRFVARARIS